jgi:glycosyltransferase involved in cell wall biosynthesis
MNINNARIGYVVKRYPRYSETFVVNEVLAHEEAGLPLELFSLRPPVDTHFQDLISRVTSPLTCLSSGRVRSGELWEALACCSDVIPDAFSLLQSFAHESVLDVYCGVRLATEAERRGLTHLHAHFASSAACVARIASRLTGIPYSITAHAKDIFHDSVCEEDLANKIHDSAFTLTVSDYNLAHLERRFPLCAGRLVRLYNGMHLDAFPFQKPTERPKRIVAVGRFVEKKGFADLIDACAILRERHVAFECLVIGSGELETSLRDQIRQRRLSQYVQMTGPCPQREVKRLIHESAVMAAPCVLGADGNRDGLPTVLLESMALGTPCVSTDVTGIPEVIRNEVTGLMVEQHSPADLADALQRLLSDSELRVSLATAARSLIECQFDATANATIQRSYFAAGVEQSTSLYRRLAEAATS